MNPRVEFAREVTVPDHQLNLARAALLFAADEYPGLDLECYLARLDALAETAAAQIGEERSPLRIMLHLSDFLHREQGFRGNTDDYSDPRNSFLNEVLERRLGIPITLSVLWIEVARRLGLPICGVGLPGHFIVKWHDDDGEEILIDPFHDGRVLTVDDCKERLRQIYGTPPLWRDQYLGRSSNREIIARMLRNLKSTYVQRNDTDRAILVIQKILIVMPESAEDIRDLGLMHLQRQDARLGLDCLEQYLRLAPNSPDADSVIEVIRTVRGNLARWN